ncbi:type VII secretion target [Lentzea sp. NPDC059081]|uniref:type VII secretion target n=1 Tax=Lentzea sp. NPDC059081 TaxID=3346719 RepID=UPI0036CA3FF7
MGDSFEVVTEELTAHSLSLVKLSDELRSAADLAGRQSMTGDAYGRTCQEFAALLDALASAGQVTLRLAAECLEGEASKVRASAAEFDRRESGTVNALRTVGRELR